MRVTTSKKPARRFQAPVPPLPMPPELFQATRTPDVVSVPPRTVLTMEGEGAPEEGAFEESVGAIYGIAYGLKFARKKAGAGDFKIGPLEARWWTEDPARPIIEAPRDTWRWQLRIAVPETVTERELCRAIIAAVRKRGGALEDSALAARVTVERLPATRYGRVLHIGPYENEGASFQGIMEAVKQAALVARGAHVEVYLNDPRRTKPANLKTVVLLELASER